MRIHSLGEGFASVELQGRPSVVRWDTRAVAAHGPPEGFASLDDARAAALELAVDGSRRHFGGRPMVVVAAADRYVPVEVDTNLASFDRSAGVPVPDDGFDPARFLESPAAREQGWQVAAAISAGGTELPLGPAPTPAASPDPAGARP